MSHLNPQHPPTPSPTDPGMQPPQDPMEEYTRNLSLFNDALNVVVDEKLFLETNLPGECTPVELQIFLDAGMAAIQRSTAERASYLFYHSPTTLNEHAARYGAALTLAEKLAAMLKIPPGHFASCLMIQTSKKINSSSTSPALKPPAKVAVAK